MLDIGTALLFLVPALVVILLGPARLATCGRSLRRAILWLAQRGTNRSTQQQP
ncbi:MAG TPA: hypothetical protein PKA05_03160 [Roseiflexaceae bacterium]|nr:hypothetical protein [Roseiflexaceae bacterium]HMP39357.1 hypothetical protein [Roseiflexaceae bacterium]